MDDGTAQVLLTVGPALIAGFGGYYGARQQGLSNARQVESETARQHHQLETENERLRVDRAETYRKERHATYGEFLDMVSRMHLLAVGVQGHGEEESFAGWLSEFNHRLNAVRLFGTDEVREAADRLSDALGALGADVDVGAGDPAFDEHFRAAYRGRYEATIRPAREALVTAMRTDVAPIDRPPAHRS